MAQEKGLTLTELLAVIVIAALLCQGSMPRLNRLLGSGRLHQTSTRVLEIIEEQASLSVLRGRDARIHFDLPDGSLSLVPEQTESAQTKLLQSPAGVRLVSARFGSIAGDAAVLTLRKDGSATPGSVILQDAELHQCKIVQALRGARRLECS